MSLYRAGFGQVVVVIATVLAVVLAVGFALNYFGVISFV